MEGKGVTILKKKKKGGAAGHHGGSWKVAFADFMTAMMAFFLLMWLLSMGPQKKQAELAHYFKTFSLFGDGGTTATQTVSIDGSPAGEPQLNPQPPAPSAPSEEEVSAEEEATNSAMEEMKAKLEQEIEERLADVKDQIVIDQFEGGIKIDIIDKLGQPMFQLGSAELTQNAKKILLVIADNIKTSTRRLEIEGHTDALAYSGKQKYGNWELSTARASAARIELEKSGLSSALLARVSGYAETSPLIKEDPFDPRNRRISLRLLYPKPPRNPPDPSQSETAPPPAH